MAFTNLDQVFEAIEKVIIQQLKNVAEEVFEKLRNNLKLKFYESRPEPEAYLRTYQLLESISIEPIKISGNTYEIKVYYDTSKIIPSSGSGGIWSQHQSVVTGEPSNEMLPWWVEYGQNSPLHSWNAYNIVGGVKKEIKEEKLLLNALKNGLKARGFTVK